MALGRRGGGGADELLSFLERGMIRGPGEEEEEESGEAGQVLRERYVLFFFSLLHRRLGGNGEKGRERKRTGEIFSPVAEEMGESGKGQLCIEKWTKPFPEGMLKLPAPQASL